MPVIKLTNLWLFYVLAYAIALPLQTWANNKRGKPFDGHCSRRRLNARTLRYTLKLL